MSQANQLRSKILGVGSYVPPNCVTNHDLVEMLDTSDEWIQQRTGIKQRYWVEPGTNTSDLAKQACEKALENAKVSKEEIDLIVFATLSGDHEFPGTGCFLQAKLGIPGVPTIDIKQQCTGFVYGLSIADQYIRTGMYKKVLVVGAEVHSTGLDRSPAGRDIAVLFGDGAGAVVVGAVPVQDLKKESCVLSTHLHTDGRFASELWVEAPGSGFYPDRISNELIAERKQLPYMNGRNVFAHASKRMPSAVQEALEANQVTPDDIDLYVFHQANQRINEMVAKLLKVPEEKVFNTIDRFANTTAATIPIGLDEAQKAGKLKPGDLVVSAAFGSGFTWASFLLRW